MFLLINAAYWLLGLVIAFAGSATIGMLINALLALVKAPARPQNLKLLVGYLFCALLGWCVVWGCLFVGGWIGDFGRAKEINFSGNWLLIGAIFPGIFALAMIPAFIGVGAKQTSGIDVE